MQGKLTATTVENAKAKRAAYKLADGAGMYLLVTPKGGKWWRLDYRYNDKRQTLSLGTYPDVTLKVARQRRQEARTLLADGTNPSEARKEERASRAHTFQSVAEEWVTKYSAGWAASNTAKVTSALARDVYPWLGAAPIARISAADVLKVLRRVESRGALETAHRVRQYVGQVFRYAVATGRAEHDVAHDLRGALPPVVTRHHASVTEPKAIGALLRAIDGYEGTFVVRQALRLAPLVFVRPGELRAAEWAEFDFENSEWRIPAARMKLPRPHIVPLAKQAVEILRALHALTGGGRYLFPSTRTTARCMSENTVNAALRRLGYGKDEMTGHGFRSLASTRLNEMGWHHDAIERQLAHVEGNRVRAAYNYAEHLSERRDMLQHWADYLDGLRDGAAVVAIRAKRPKKS